VLAGEFEKALAYNHIYLDNWPDNLNMIKMREIHDKGWDYRLMIGLFQRIDDQEFIK